MEDERSQVTDDLKQFKPPVWSFNWTRECLCRSDSNSESFIDIYNDIITILIRRSTLKYRSVITDEQRIRVCFLAHQIPADEVCGCPLVKDVFEPTGEFCRVSKRKCNKHYCWEKLRRAEVDLERVRVVRKKIKLY